MNIIQWLEAEKGRSAAMAAHFGRTPAAISQWKTNGVPVHLMRAVSSFTGGAVTLDELVPGRPIKHRPAGNVREIAQLTAGQPIPEDQKEAA